MDLEIGTKFARLVDSRQTGRLVDATLAGRSAENSFGNSFDLVETRQVGRFAGRYSGR